MKGPSHGKVTIVVQGCHLSKNLSPSLFCYIVANPWYLSVFECQIRGNPSWQVAHKNPLSLIAHTVTGPEHKISVTSPRRPFYEGLDNRTVIEQHSERSRRTSSSSLLHRQTHKPAQNNTILQLGFQKKDGMAVRDKEHRRGTSPQTGFENSSNCATNTF